MAQLVKLYDYISRYEANPFHYPSQYVRLKQENWKKLNEKWQREGMMPIKTKERMTDYPKKFKWNPFKQNEEPEEEVVHELPDTKQQLKQYFLNQLFPVQIKWATSTLTQESFTKISLKDTDILKFFLQRFPDIYLLMYYPVFNIQNAPIDGEIILIGPFEIEIIHLMNHDPETRIIATDDRKWTIETKYSQETILSPVIALKRTEHIVKGILQTRNVEMQVTKSIISENNHILYSSEPYQTNIIGKQDYHKWFEMKRNVQSSLKSVQLRAMSALLDQCQTSAVNRPEWESERKNPMSGNQEDL